MKIKADAKLSYPRDVVFASYRDKLVELVPHLPNIKAIEVKNREDNEGVTRMLNIWHAKGDIPKVAQSIIKPEMVCWEDHAKWNQDDWTCEWKVVPKFFTKNVTCSGKNHFVEQGDETVLQIRGELEIDAKGIPGVPRLLAGRIAPVIEKFIVGLLTPNLLTVSDGLVKYLDSNKG